MDNFVQVPDDIVLSEKLSLNEKMLMCVLLYYERLVKWGKNDDIHPNQTTLARQCNMSVKSVARAVKGLKEKKFIKTTQKVDRSSLVYELNTKMVRTESLDVKTVRPHVRTERPDGQDLESEGLGLRVHVGTTRKDYKELDKAIVDFLNSTCGKKYKHTTPKTISLIKARVKEGFKLEDFKTVITNKYNEWNGNEEMSAYLRPETLFGTKFESYLNQPKQQTDEEKYGRWGKRIIT